MSVAYTKSRPAPSGEVISTSTRSDATNALEGVGIGAFGVVWRCGMGLR
ncbi:hypothetical protein XOCgx_1029 [Xanthomonas oryzae pv. oryzicola]|nr:hypothetical protein XOCgx_1029 [Xanthomonas oryzae pv. oryzicola]